LFLVKHHEEVLLIAAGTFVTAFAGDSQVILLGSRWLGFSKRLESTAGLLHLSNTRELSVGQAGFSFHRNLIRQETSVTFRIL
jgi:hypothetical protein